MNSFNDKVIWITGASGGIGEELARQLSKEGAKIILTARNVEKLNAVKESLEGEAHWVYPIDLMQVAAIPAAAEKVLKEVGSVDMLINNAGISQRSEAKDTSLDIDRRIMELDYFAAVALTKAVLPKMIERKNGYIVAISSVAGKFGAPKRSAYAGAKHAIIGFMDALRAETHKYNLKVTNVTPGPVNTNISINALHGDGKKHNVKDPMIANGMPVDVCATKIIRGLKKNKPEILVATGKVKFAVYARRFFPRLLFKMLTTAQAT